MALFGSGYDSDGDPSVKIGHYFYCVDIETGAVLRSFPIDEGSKEPVSPFGIQNTLPGSPAVVDVEHDAFFLAGDLDHFIFVRPDYGSRADVVVKDLAEVDIAV